MADIASVYELYCSVKESDGSNPTERAILKEFVAWMELPTTRQKFDRVERRFNATRQVRDLFRKYQEVLEEVDESNKLMGDRLTIKQVLVKSIVSIHPYLNRSNPDLFVNVLKACKSSINGPQKYKEGTAIIHGSSGRRSVLIGNLLDSGKCVYIRKNQLELLGLREEELFLHTGENGAYLSESLGTVLNMTWNETGCVNRNMNAVPGACKERINSCCILVVNRARFHHLHNGQADDPIIPNVRPALFGGWDSTVVRHLRSGAPWLPVVNSIHYERKEELRQRLNPTRTRRHPRNASTTRSGSSANNASTASAAAESPTEISSSDDEGEENEVIASVIRREGDIRVRCGESLYSGIRDQRLYPHRSPFGSFLLCRSTIDIPTPRQLQFDDCLKPLDPQLVGWLVCEAKTFPELVSIICDLINNSHSLLDIDPFSADEFEKGEELYIPLLEVAINANHANVGGNERKATFFMHLWEAHEYKQKHRLEDEFVVIPNLHVKWNKKSKTTIEKKICALDKWLLWVS